MGAGFGRVVWQKHGELTNSEKIIIRKFSVFFTFSANVENTIFSENY